MFKFYPWLFEFIKKFDTCEASEGENIFIYGEFRVA